MKPPFDLKLDKTYYLINTGISTSQKGSSIRQTPTYKIRFTDYKFYIADHHNFGGKAKKIKENRKSHKRGNPLVEIEKMELIYTVEGVWENGDPFRLKFKRRGVQLFAEYYWGWQDCISKSYNYDKTYLVK